MNEQFNLQRVLHLSGNPYESKKSYDKIINDIYWKFENNPPFTYQNFRRDISDICISIQDSVYGKLKKNERR